MRRQLVRAAAFAVALFGIAAVGLPTANVVQPSQARLDGGKVIVRKIHRYERATWGWQRLMGVRRTPTLRLYLKTRNSEYRLHVLAQWRRRAIHARHRAHNPPHERAWRCLQSYEGEWTDSGDPYWGGLQMDRSFMSSYAPRHLLRRGWADRWSAVEQMWVGERALRAGRGFHPWPNAASVCGLI